MRQIHCEQIKAAVKNCVIKANLELPQDIQKALLKAKGQESNPLAQKLLGIILENAHLARQDSMAICQDTGLVAVIVEMGQEVHIVGGDINAAINAGIKAGYQEGYFRKSVVSDPLKRVNSGDNTPAVIHYQLMPGDGFKICVFPKGAGSENMSQLQMLSPSAGLNGVCEFVLKVVQEAGANACPPLIVGVGLGGNLEKVAQLAKQALLRHIDIPHNDSQLAALEGRLLVLINQLGIGPQGLGGQTTALAVNIASYPTHIASLPVAVNLGCHATRRSSCCL